MSHLTTIKTEFKNLDALRDATECLGLTLLGAGDVRFYNGVQSADHVIKLPGRYDVGFSQQAGTDTLIFVGDGEVLSTSDTGRNAEARAVFGDNLGRLKQEYAAAVVTRQAALNGLTADRVTDGQGVVRLTLRR